MASSVFGSIRKAVAALALVAGVLAAPVADAQSRKQTIIRDAEIEAILRQYSTPIFTAAGVGSRDAQIILVHDKTFNAFVASGRRMMINTGTLLQAKTPNEVIGVIAHETGHLAGGHLENLRNEVARAQAIGAVVSMLGVAGMAAGMAAGSSSATRMGAAAATAGPGVGMRNLLSYRRAQELAADRAALKYLNATQQSAKGMVTTFQRFADQQLLSARYADPYAQSHPMARDRLAQLEEAGRKSPHWDKTDSPELQILHDMMRAKISAFTESPSAVGRRFPRSDQGIPAQYARAIVAYRTGGRAQALKTIDSLIARVPNYAYFHELKGQILLESGKPQEALGPLRQAVALAPDSGLIRIMLAQAQIAIGDEANLNKAVGNLRVGLKAEPLAAIGHRTLAIALRRQGNVAGAELATAEGHLIDGELDTAKAFAKRAQAKLAYGSPGWLQANEIINTEPPNKTN